METFIIDELKKLDAKNIVPFHMPGHKRKDIFGDYGQYDITEIRGYDNLHSPEGIIKKSMEELSRVYQTKKSWYLVNGSTTGLHAAIAATCKHGEHIVVGRNCHKAVYHIAEVLQLHVHYLMTDLDSRYHLSLGMGETAIQQLNEYMKHYPVKAVVITSPTYEGVVSDIHRFQSVLKEYEVPLIVDEAHGPHMKFHEAFPKSAVEQGADIVIQSSHKTLPSMTQSALLHLCSDRVSAEQISRYLAIFQTSSPSYVLMASAEYGVAYMENYPQKMIEYVDNLSWFIKQCEQLKHIRLLNKNMIECYDYDIGKLVFLLKDLSIKGKEFADLLYDKYKIELEMSEIYHGIAMTSVMDEKADYEKLWNAVSEIDASIHCVEEEKEKNKLDRIIIPDKKMESWEVESYPSEMCKLENAIGRIVTSYINVYPPGIPLLVPGEKIVKEIVENIDYYLYNGYDVTGLDDGKVSVIK